MCIISCRWWGQDILPLVEAQGVGPPAFVNRKSIAYTVSLNEQTLYCKASFHFDFIHTHTWRLLEWHMSQWQALHSHFSEAWPRTLLKKGKLYVCMRAKIDSMRQEGKDTCAQGRLCIVIGPVSEK